MDGLIYVGDGSSVGVVPARNLSGDEVKVHGGENVLLATGLYAKPGKPQAATPVSKKEKDKESES